MKKIDLDAVAIAVAERNGESISRELREALEKAQTAGISRKEAGNGSFLDIPVKERALSFRNPLSAEAEVILLLRGKTGDRDAKLVLFSAYEGLVRKRAAHFFYDGDGRRILGDFDEALSMACEAFYQAIDEAVMIRNGRLINMSNVFGVVAFRYEIRERLNNMDIFLPANLYHVANRMNGYLDRNGLQTGDITRELCEKTGFCDHYGWKSVKDACNALNTVCCPFTDDAFSEDADTFFEAYSGDIPDNLSPVLEDTEKWIMDIIRDLSKYRQVRVFADYHGLNKERTGYALEMLSKKYGTNRKALRRELIEARIMISDEMRRRDPDAVSMLENSRNLNELRSQAEYLISGDG